MTLWVCVIYSSCTCAMLYAYAYTSRRLHWSHVAKFSQLLAGTVTACDFGFRVDVSSPRSCLHNEAQPHLITLLDSSSPYLTIKHSCYIQTWVSSIA